MNTLSLKQIELYNLIPYLNIQDIEKIVSFAKKNNIIHKKLARKSLAGIWSDLNFEGIDLNDEIKKIRKEISNKLDNKEL